MKKHHFIYILAFLIYILVNLLTMNTFPFVHSDESWLAGLSLTIKKAGTFQTTEAFFTLFPRQAHTIKSLFHLIQGTWMSLFGYGMIQVRLLSFTVSMLFLIVFFRALYKTALKTSSKKVSGLMAGLSTGLVAVSLQFVYASHFGRQESFILLFMGISYFYTQNHLVNAHKSHALKASVFASIITVTAIGFHPNSFLIACVIGMVLLYDGLINKRVSPLLIYTACTGIFAGLYIYVSTLWSKNFFTDYGAYAVTQGVSESLLQRALDFPTFVSKIFNQISGTYYAPDIRMEIILFALLFVLTTYLLAYRWFKYRKHTPLLALPLLGALGLTSGLVLIGRYNATSIVFYVPFVGLMAFGLMKTLASMKVSLYKTYTLLGLILLILGCKTAFTIFQPPLETYTSYTNEVLKAIDTTTLGSDTSKVLCNLNAGFAFEPDYFLDYRDLAYLKRADLSLEAYLTSNHINYIVLSEEMDYIYRNPDPWDMLYGPMDYYPELINTIEKDYTLVHSFESPLYGMRVVRYNDGYPWTVRVFKKIR